MEKLKLSNYINKQTGDSLTAELWNKVFEDIQTKVNELVDAQVDTKTDTTTIVSNNNLFINGKLYTDDVITLAAGNTYKMEGTYTGQIIIDAETTQPSSDTFIRMNGVTIISNVASPILYKTPEDNTGYKGLTITLGRNTVNTVISTNVAEKTDDQPGAIYSMNHLSIKGPGYLTVINKGGHGLRASQLRLTSSHIYVEAVHDAFHAGKKLIVDDGYYYVNKANDAFGTGTDGNILVFGGHFRAYNVAEDLFDSKVAGYYLNLDDIDYVAESFGSNMSAYTWGEGKVEESDDETTYTEVTATDGIYNITKHYVRVSGKITGRIVSPSASTTQDNGTGGTEAWQKLDIELNNAYIESNINGSTINYQSENSRLKIKVASDTINIVKNSDSELGTGYDTDAIKSENNITIEPKNNSYLYVTSVTGDGIDGGTVLISDGDGSIVVKNCGGRGIKGNAIIPGPNASVTKSVIGSYITDSTNSEYTTFDGALIVTDNHEYLAVDSANTSTTGFADIFARNGGASKGAFGTTDTELRGIVVVGSIAAAVKLDLNNADNIYATKIIGAIHSVEPTIHDSFVIPYNKIVING